MVKHFTLLSLLAALCFQAPAWAALSEADKAVFPFQNRILSNPGFELSKAGWAVSGGTFTVQSAVKDAGNAAGLWTPGASAQTLTSTLVAVPDGLRGRNGVVSCAFRTGTGSTAHTLTADDGTNNLAAPQTITPSTMSFQRKSVNLIFPTTGSVRMKLTSASTDQVYIDSCYFDLAEGFNLMQVSQASLYATLNTTGAAPTTNSPSYADLNLAVGTNTVIGNCSYVSGIGGLTCANLPAGKYEVVVNGLMGAALATTTTRCDFALTDGTTTGPSVTRQDTSPSSPQSASFNTMSYAWEYSTAQSSKVFKVVARRTAGDGDCRIISNGAGISGSDKFSMVVRYFPLTSELAYRPEQGPRSATVSFPSAASCNPLVTAASWTDMASANCTGATFTGGASTVGVTNGIGMRVGSVKQGAYLALGLGEVYAGSPSGTICRFRVSDGTNFTPMVQAESGGSTDRLSSVGGIITYGSDQTNVDLRLQAYRSAGTGSCGMWAGDSGNKFQIALIPLDRLMDSPLFVGTVTADTSGFEKMARANVGSTCSSDPCVMDPNPVGISSIKRNSTGSYTINFSTSFTATPSCSITPGGAVDSLVISGSISASSWSFGILGRGTGTNVDNRFNVLCFGPR